MKVYLSLHDFSAKQVFSDVFVPNLQKYAFCWHTRFFSYESTFVRKESSVDCDLRNFVSIHAVKVLFVCV